jgi:O-antigen ligase
MYLKGWLKIATLIVFFVFLLVVSIYSQPINSRMTSAISELQDYLALDDHADPENYAGGTSVGIRLEMLRVAPLVLIDHTLLGVGNGNYQKTVKQYAEQRMLHPEITHHTHPHNVFVGAAVDKGLLGLIATLLVFFFPLYVYFKTYKLSKYSALSGILYVTTMFIFSMNETAPFEKSNFLATYLVFSLIIFQNHMRHIKSPDAE